MGGSIKKTVHAELVEALSFSLPAKKERQSFDFAQDERALTSFGIQPHFASALALGSEDLSGARSDDP